MSAHAIVVDLPLDADFELRLGAARRFWLALEGRALGMSPLALPALKQRRLILALRAVDAWQKGNSYRQIAQGLFGSRRIAERAWKQTICAAKPFDLLSWGGASCAFAGELAPQTQAQG
ncbi:DUF2285 domain-containing protein [Bradyrhizobium japonicum]|uniref:DUF2285 domain-containing protein n=1 Tax=Bradyrhizobium japonicum TaxID=375 RepID=UPI000A70CBA7|nr:DUF2285 domain-containing protein [Bradyrhizobium japonicum]